MVLMYFPPEQSPRQSNDAQSNLTSFSTLADPDEQQVHGTTSEKWMKKRIFNLSPSYVSR